jgi:hypothetical protein
MYSDYSLISKPLKAFVSLYSPASFYYFSKQTLLSIPVSLKLCKTSAGVTSNFAAIDKLFLCTFTDDFIMHTFFHFQPILNNYVHQKEHK